MGMPTKALAIACPKCRGYMYPGRHQGVELDLCSGCHGIWLDRDELSTITGKPGDLPEPAASTPTPYACPRCGGALEERPYTSRADLKVDVCRSCRGVYLDKGELLMVEELSKGVSAAFPPLRRDEIAKQSRRREALSAAYKTKEPAAKAPLSERAVFVRNVYLLLIGTLLVTGLGCWIAITHKWAEQWFRPILIGELALFFVALWVRRVPVLNLLMLGLYTFTSGVTLGVILGLYLQAGHAGIVLQAFGITITIFLGLTAYVHVTRRDFQWMGGTLFAFLLGLVASGFVLLFTGGSFAHFLWSSVGVFVFTGYILYDTSNILLKYDTDEVVAAVLDLYLDIVNLFLDLLRVLSYLERD
jgi:FtsH-binding integral membrane protein